jgi:hypothetical protein
MKIFTQRSISVLSILFIGLSANLAFGGANCPSSMRQQSTKFTPVPSLSEQLAGETDTDAKIFLKAKKQEALTTEQIAAANLKCYADLHRDLDGMAANESCDVMPSNTAHVRGQKIVR